MWPDKDLEYIKLPADAEGIHYGLFADGWLVSVVSIFEKAGEIQFRKFATAVEYQGRGYGTTLLTYVIMAAKAGGASAIWCNARKDKAAFYAKFGLESTGEEFEREGIKYITMRKNLLINSSK